jgi:hypothetical protein
MASKIIQLAERHCTSQGARRVTRQVGAYSEPICVCNRTQPRGRVKETRGRVLEHGVPRRVSYRVDADALHD